MRKGLGFCILLYFIVISSKLNAEKNFSVLSSGDWFKIAIAEDGVYKVDYDFLVESGLDVQSLDPQLLQVYGNGGHMLPQCNSVSRPDDLIENAIFISGGDDGRFDPGDYILFYGQSSHKLGFIEANNTIEVEYENHFYSDSSYYFITLGDTPGRRISVVENPDQNFPTITSFDDLQFHELNLRKLSSVPSGREWYGEVFRDGVSVDIEFESEGLVSNSNIQLISGLMAASKTGSSFSISINGVEWDEINIESIPDATYGVKGKESYDNLNYNASGLPSNTYNITITLEYNSGSSNATGYLMHLNLWLERELSTFQSQTKFRSLKSILNTNSTFIINDTGNPVSVWEISTPDSPIMHTLIKGDGNYKFSTGTGGLKEFILYNIENVKAPTYTGRIENQNLHALTSPELLIITHPDFLSAAKELASFRQSGGISSEVVTIEQIFNEFSSGSQDVTGIRDFIKFLYDQNEENPELQHVLLLGKGSYDYKDIGLSPYYNFVPIYESRNSLHPIYSYSSDDYFGFLEDHEGEWEESFSGDHDLDISIGRIPVISAKEANDVINKIILYDSDPAGMGPWRNNISFVADDGDGTDGIRHSLDADRLSVLVDTSYSNFNIEKIYIDAYTQNILPNNVQTAPEVNEAINNAIKNGVLILNYTGHGNEQQWAHETVLDKTMINGWKNQFTLPLFVTATCEFGRHDDKQRSAAEIALINDRGGAIGLVTTARPVFASSNFILNKAFYQNVFEKENGRYQTIGEIFAKTKNSSLNGSVNRNFSFLGDPSMKLAYPDEQIVLEKINESLINNPDTLQALKKISITGMIYNADSNPITEFNGILSGKIYDKKGVYQTLGTQDPVMTYEEQKSLIFNGDVTVKNGNFEIEFIIPKNISYDLGDGRISLYAYNNNRSIDASGSNNSVIVGGSIEVIDPDNISPEISLFLNDTTFVSGELTSNQPVLIARLFDESGISIIENGVNPGIVAILDDDNTYVLNNFYKAEINNFQNGEVRYQLTDLEEGDHQIKLKVWDTHNNMTESTIDFIIGESNKLVIQNLLNYPNPFRDETTFSFEHNRTGEDIEININIYSSMGELVKTISGVTFSSDFRINDISWDGRGGSGKKLETGLYIYSVFLRSLRDGAKNIEYKKLLIIN